MSITWRRRWFTDAVKRAAVAVAFWMLAGSAWAASVSVSGAFARATPPGAVNGVVYLTLCSDQDDALTGVSSPVARGAMLHKTTMAGMVMDMDMLSKIDLPAGQAVVLQPDQMHIMLTGLKQPLVKGSSIPLHLTFAYAPALDIDVPVGSIAAAAPGE
jgi:copper(I)-binding protein